MVNFYLPGRYAVNALYHFNDNVIDDSGYDNNGVGTAITYGAGKYNNCVQFNGSSSLITVPAMPHIADIFAGGGTFCCWFYANNAGEGGSGVIAEKGYTSLAGFRLDFYTANKLGFYIRTTSVTGQYHMTNSDATYSTWHHLAITWNSSTMSVPRMFIDGDEVALTEVAAPTGVYKDDTDYDLLIGDRSSGAHCFDGKFDDFMLFNRILSDGEIDALADATSQYNPIPTVEDGMKVAIMNSSLGIANATAMANDTIWENGTEVKSIYGERGFVGEFYTPGFGEWFAYFNEEGAYAPPTIYGFLLGGWTGSATRDYIQTIDTTVTIQNAVDSGNLTVSRTDVIGVDCRAIGFGAGGTTGSVSDVIDYINVDIRTQNSTDRGNLSEARRPGCGLGNTRYGFVCGGLTTVKVNTIDYIDATITGGNAIDVGDMTQVNQWCGWGQSNLYGFICGGAPGATSSPTNVIEYIDLNITAQNGTDVGDLTVARYGMGGVSGNVYSFQGGGALTTSPYNTIDYINLFVLTQNAVDRGDLTVARRDLTASDGSVFGFFAGGFGSTVIDYIDMTSTVGNAVDTGDTIEALVQMGGI